MRNDFERMCKRLDKCRRGCEYNPYKCAEEAVENFVGTDRNKLLQLKAEVKGGDFYSYSAFRIAVIALIVTCISICLGMFGGDGLINSIAYVIIVLATVIYVIVQLLSICRFNDVLKWRNYISVAVEEVEKELGQRETEESRCL